MSAQAWAIVAAILYLAGLVVLFGIRTWRHRRATGTSGFKGFSSRDRWARAAGLLFALSLLVGAIAPVQAALGLMPLLAPPGLVQPLAVIGLLLSAAGLALAWAAQSSMGPAWRVGVDPDETTALVTTGVFGRVRNPIFSAMIAAQTGTALMAPTWMSLSALAALILAVQLQVRRVEEPYLRTAHGASYLIYTAQVGRFVPLLGRGRMPVKSGGGLNDGALRLS